MILNLTYLYPLFLLFLLVGFGLHIGQIYFIFSMDFASKSLTLESQYW